VYLDGIGAKPQRAKEEMGMLSVNAEAMKIVRQILAAPEALGVEVMRFPNGATLIDMGQSAPGSWQAARYFTLVTLGGLGEVSYESFTLGNMRLPGVRVMVNRPLEACMGCQVAGWVLVNEPDAPILSGPARALNNPADHYFDYISYRDHYHEGVVTVQMTRPVTEDMAERMARACSLAPENLYILASRHACLVTTVQVPARVVELTMHRLALAKFDLTCIRHASCYAPIPPLVHDELSTFGRINDALIYGGEAHFYVETSDDLLLDLVPRVVTAASRIGGKSFSQLYREANYDFHAIPADMHTPAILHMTNLHSGRTFSAGHFDEAVLRRSFFEENVHA
jgi:methenyltetrahydromethanopterin cyclohydrolase